MNKQYFNYLLKSNKVLFAFIALVELSITAISGINSNIGANTAAESMWGISIVLAFALPVLLFNHAQNKKAVDLYFSLPVKRKDIAITTIITILLAILVPASLISIVLLIIKGIVIDYWLLYFLCFFTVISALVLFNTGIFLIGNNTFDGVVMLGAYHLIPAFASFLENAINTAIYYGFFRGITYSSHLSLIFVSTEYIDNLLSIIFRNHSYLENSSIIPTIIVSIVYMVIGLISIIKNYIHRKSERAGTISDSLFAYPFTIYFVATVILLSITLSVYSYNINPMLELLIDNLFPYIFVIIAFTIARFIYKRKFEINIKSLAYLALVIAVGLVSVKAIQKTEGFGLSYKYNRNPEMIEVNLSYNNMKYEDAIYSDRFDDVSIYFAHEFTIKDECYDEVISYINNLRDNCIRNHFNGDDDGNGYLSVSTNSKYSYGFNNQYEDYYGYYNIDLSLEDFKFFNRFEDVYVYVADYENNDFRDITLNEYLELTQEAK